jgi:hypothetical protein
MYTIVIFTFFALAGSPSRPVVTKLPFAGTSDACNTAAMNIGFGGGLGSGVNANGYTVTAKCVPNG